MLVLKHPRPFSETYSTVFRNRPGRLNEIPRGIQWTYSPRKKIQKKQFDSKLDGIPGIGKNRKLDILKFFGGIQGVLKSSTEDLTRVPNISDKLATIIYHHLHK